MLLDHLVYHGLVQAPKLASHLSASRVNSVIDIVFLIFVLDRVKVELTLHRAIFALILQVSIRAFLFFLHLI